MRRNHFISIQAGKNRHPLSICVFCLIFLLVGSNSALAQTPIQQATDEVNTYFEDAVLLMYAVGALLGLVGAVKVYTKWNSGDQDTGKVAASWFGSCVFLIVVATVLRAFFL